MLSHSYISRLARTSRACLLQLSNALLSWEYAQCFPPFVSPITQTFVLCVIVCLFVFILVPTSFGHIAFPGLYLCEAELIISVFTLHKLLSVVLSVLVEVVALQPTAREDSS